MGGGGRYDRGGGHFLREEKGWCSLPSFLRLPPTPRHPLLLQVRSPPPKSAEEALHPRTPTGPGLGAPWVRDRCRTWPWDWAASSPGPSQEPPYPPPLTPLTPLTPGPFLAAPCPAWGWGARDSCAGCSGRERRAEVRWRSWAGPLQTGWWRRAWGRPLDWRCCCLESLPQQEPERSLEIRDTVRPGQEHTWSEH